MSNNIFSGDIKPVVHVRDDIPKRNIQNLTCYLCDDNTKSWESETELYIHKNQKHKKRLTKIYGAENTTTCRICLKVCESRKQLRTHIRTAHLLSSEDTRRVEREIFVCNECNEIFFNKVLLQIHLAKRHSMAVKDKIYECPKCAKKMILRQIYMHFNRMHEFKSLWSCPICLSKCSNSEELKTHIQTHPKYYHCNICSFTCQRQNQFQQHIDKHMSDSEEFYSNREFVIDTDVLESYFVPKMNNAKRDSVNMYRGLKLFEFKVCVLCREICKKKDMLDHLKCHLVSKEEEDKSGFVCCCGQQFDNKILLKQHSFKMQCENTVYEGDSIDIEEDVLVVIVAATD